MPDILELMPLDMSRLHREGRGSTLQRPDAGHFVDRHGVRVLLGGGRRRLVDRANVGAFGIEFRIRLGRQPIAAAMRLEVRSFFKKRPTEPCEILLTMPRLTA